jgi:hypothetical protein
VTPMFRCPICGYEIRLRLLDVENRDDYLDIDKREEGIFRVRVAEHGAKHVAMMERQVREIKAGWFMNMARMETEEARTPMDNKTNDLGMTQRFPCPWCDFVVEVDSSAPTAKIMEVFEGEMVAHIRREHAPVEKNDDAGTR